MHCQCQLYTHLVIVACIEVGATFTKEADHLDGAFTGGIEDGMLLKVCRKSAAVASK